METLAPTENAASWLVRLESDPTPQCQAEFTAWLERSPDNMEEFLLVTAAAEEIARVGSLVNLDIETSAAEAPSNVVGLKKPHLPQPLPPCGAEGSTDGLLPLRPAGGGSSHAMSGCPRMDTLGFRGAGTAKRNGVGVRWGGKQTWAAGLAAAAAIAVLAWQLRPQLASPTYETAVGEQRTIKLDDGSVVQMNTQSRMQVRFSGNARDVKLLEGEALFVVGQDARRPFRVATDTAVVQALGTQFNVYRREDGTTVSVVQGLVRVSPANSSGGGKDILAAGEEAKVAGSGSIVKRASHEIAAQATAWRQRKLDFRGATLAEVAAEFNRYNKMQIRVAPGAAAGKQLNGVFNADEPQALLDFLAGDETLRVEKNEAQIVIYLR